MDDCLTVSILQYSINFIFHCTHLKKQLTRSLAVYYVERTQKCLFHFVGKYKQSHEPISIIHTRKEIRLNEFSIIEIK